MPQNSLSDARPRISVLYSYVVTTDSGFAPNPFFGVCTLACCQPAIRKAVSTRLLRRSGKVDAIYTGNDPATARQLAPCTHSAGDREDEGNKHHDLNGRYVLLSDHFVYVGADAPYDPVEQRLHHGRGHSSNHSSEAIAELEALLDGPWAELFDDSGIRAPTPSISARGCRGPR